MKKDGSLIWAISSSARAFLVILLGSDDARILKFHNRDGETLTLEVGLVSDEKEKYFRHEFV